MSRRGDNIRKRKDGRWEARYSTGICADGKYRYASVYGATYQEAKNKRLQILSAPPATTPVQKQTLLFRDLLQRWLAASRVRLKESTVSRYQYLMDVHILPQFGSLTMDSLTAFQINCFLADKLKAGRLDQTGGLSAAYVRSIMLIINAAIAYGASEGLCVPLTAKVFKPVLPKQELPILNPAQQMHLESALQQNMDRTNLGIMLSLYAGLRIGEVCALRRSDIDTEARLIHVRQTVTRIRREENGKMHSRYVIGPPKTQSSLRTIPLCSKLSHIVAPFLHIPADCYLLSGGPQFLNPRTYEYRYKQQLHSCAIAPTRYHALRHTFATRCIESGMDAKTLSELLGHANAAITLNIYVHSSLEMKRSILEKIGY